MSEVCARDFRRFPVGRLIGSTKIRYEWELIVSGELLSFMVLHSKLSKSFRLFLNSCRLLERTDSSNDISLLVIVDRNTFAFSKKTDEVTLAVNSKPFGQLFALPSLVKRREFSTLESKKSKRLDDLASPEHSLYNTVDLTKPRNFPTFTFTWKSDVCSIKRDSPTFTPVFSLGNSEVSTPQDSPCPSPSPTIPTPVYKYLNDSSDFYMHEFMYLFTQEVPEDTDLVRSVNDIAQQVSPPPPRPPDPSPTNLTESNSPVA